MLLALLQALKYWLEIQATRAKWQLERDIETYVETIEADILASRARGDDARADRLLQHLARSSAIALPAAAGRDTTPSSGPNVPSH
jgi:hypothetical protein